MKNKILLVSFVLLLSCGEKKTKPPVDLNKDKKTIQVVNDVESLNTNTSIPQIPREIAKEEKTISVSNPTKKTSEVKTKKFYNDLLNEFCKKYFYRKFKGTHYIYGSIVIERVSKEDENTVEIKGAHSFKNRIKTFEQRDFFATIRDRGNNKYNILFRRRSTITGQWKDTGNIMFTYNTEE